MMWNKNVAGDKEIHNRSRPTDGSDMGVNDDFKSAMMNEKKMDKIDGRLRISIENLNL